MTALSSRAEPPGHEKGHPRRAIRLDDPLDDVPVYAGNRRQLAQPGGPPDAASIRASLGRLEDPRRRGAVGARRQVIEDFVGVPRSASCIPPVAS